MDFKTDNKYVFWGGELIEVEPQDQEQKVIIKGNNTASFHHEECDFRTDTWYTKDEQPEDVIYLPFVGETNFLIGSIFEVKEPQNYHNWTGGCDIKGLVFMEGISNCAKRVQFNINGYCLEVEVKDNLQQFMDKYKLEYLGNIFDRDNGNFKDYEKQRLEVKNSYLLRVIYDLNNTVNKNTEDFINNLAPENCEDLDSTLEAFNSMFPNA